MKGWIPKDIWDSVDFLTLPEHGWTANLIAHVKLNYKWDIAKMNDFVSWVKPPPQGSDTLEYMKDMAATFEKQPPEGKS